MGPRLSILALLFLTASVTEAAELSPVLIEDAVRAPYETTIHVGCDTTINSPPKEPIASGEAGDNISVVSSSTAQKLFSKLAPRKDIPYLAPDDGCYVRAHQVSKALEDLGIISGKIFIEGDLRAASPTNPGKTISWDSGFHVVSFVFTKNSKRKLVPLILDPTFFPAPVSLEHFIESVTGSTKLNGNPRLTKIFFRNRFTYTDPDENASSWDEGNQEFRESALQDLLEKAEKQRKLMRDRRNQHQN